MLITSVSSFALGITVAMFIVYCHMHAHHKPPTSLTSKEAIHSASQASEYQDLYQDVPACPLKSTKPPISSTSKELRQAEHSASQASEYQDVYEAITEVPTCPLKWTELDIIQNSVYGHIHEVSTNEGKLKESSDCVVFNPIYSLSGH